MCRNCICHPAAVGVIVWSGLRHSSELGSAGKLLDTGLHFRDFTEATAMALRAICLWPGLPAAWMLGLARGLLVALVYAWCICGLLLATFVWPDWVAVSLLRLLWLIAVGTWSVATVRNCMYLPRLLATCDAHSSQALISAQREYLRGNWFDAEASVLKVLHHHPRDAEALLLLVGILRRTQRFQPALRRLKQLELLQSAAMWHFEMQRERVWITRAMAQEKEAAEDEPTEGELPKDEPTEDVLSEDVLSEDEPFEDEPFAQALTEQVSPVGYDMPLDAKNSLR